MNSLRRVCGAGLIALDASASAPARAPRTVQAQARELPDFTELVERVGPAVVNIRTAERGRTGAQAAAVRSTSRCASSSAALASRCPTTRQQPRRGRPRDEDSEPQQRGVGSGFVLTADGYVMTNAHVVDGADEVIVTLTDKREFKARIIGADKRTDVAVVKIEAAGLPTVKIGDVSQVKVGAWVIAIGSPFNLENTVTAGIVSAKQRDTGEFLPLFQTDVAINPGNSGGPLINMRGEVIGINSQIYSRSGGYMGISFAIPIDEAIRVSDQLRASGRVIRGRIGVTIAPVTKEVAESIGLGKPIGALVQGVESGGPADKAGVEAGDIITKVDGKPIEKSGDLPRIVGATKPGAKTTLQVFRRGATRDVAVTVVEFEPEKPRRVAQARRRAARTAEDRDWPGGVGSHRGAEARAEAARRRARRNRRRCCGARRPARGRRDRHARQHRGHRRQAVQRAGGQGRQDAPDQRDGAARRVDQLPGDPANAALTAPSTRRQRTGRGRSIPPGEISA